MYRFIAYRVYADGKWYSGLKSNMDRFIVIAIIAVTKLLGYLKSNMDRFIVEYDYKHRALKNI
mgnify:CR=1 FL=1